MTIMETDVVETTTTEELNIEEGTWLMDPSLKQRWVTALRSGKYRQGTSHFEHNGRFCVLGVLCAVAGQPTGAANFEYVNKTIPGPMWNVNRLFLMNDGGASFDELANFIEKNY